MAKANKAKRFTAIQAGNLRAVTSAALNMGTSRTAAINALRAATGAKPLLTLWNGARDALIVGFMAAYMIRKGDNRPADELVERSRLVIGPTYAGATTKGKLPKSKVGRRSKPEEAAYLSARVQVSGLAKEAGVTIPKKSGTGQNGTPKGRKGKGGKGKGKPETTRPVVRTIKSADQLIEYFHGQAKALQATFQRSIKGSDDPRLAELGDALQPFVAKVMNVQ